MNDNEIYCHFVLTIRVRNVHDNNDGVHEAYITKLHGMYCHFALETHITNMMSLNTTDYTDVLLKYVKFHWIQEKTTSITSWSRQINAFKVNATKAHSGQRERTQCTLTSLQSSGLLSLLFSF